MSFSHSRNADVYRKVQARVTQLEDYVRGRQPTPRALSTVCSGVNSRVSSMGGPFRVENYLYRLLSAISLEHPARPSLMCKERGSQLIESRRASPSTVQAILMGTSISRRRTRQRIRARAVPGEISNPNQRSMPFIYRDSPAVQSLTSVFNYRGHRSVVVRCQAQHGHIQGR